MWQVRRVTAERQSITQGVSPGGPHGRVAAAIRLSFLGREGWASKETGRNPLPGVCRREGRWASLRPPAPLHAPLLTHLCQGSYTFLVHKIGLCLGTDTSG